MATKDETFSWERAMHPHMDKWYTQNGATVDRSLSCRQFDVIGGDKRVEEKFLFSGREYTRLLVEIVQDLFSFNWGWYKDVDADVLCWCYCPTDRVSAPISVYWVDYPMLKEYISVFLHEQDRWMEMQICIQNFGVTVNLPISWEVLVERQIANRLVFGFR